MEQKIIHEFLDANECEQFLQTLEIILQCREMERRLAAQQIKKPVPDQTSTAKKHMTLLVHAQLCRTQRNVRFLRSYINIYQIPVPKRDVPC
jgi:hypothetical protein